MKKKLIRIILCVIAIMCISAITAFADEAYTYKDGVLTINTNDGLSRWPSSVDINNVTSIVIGSGVTDAADFSSLNGCSNVANITFRNKATVNGKFSGLLNLTTVTFENDCTISNAFSGCGKLETITFEGTSNLTDAFSGCSNIKSITFGGATTIDSAFSSSNKLTTLVFPAGSEIKNNAFSYNTGLESVTFKGDITLGGKHISNTYSTKPFSDCTNLKSVTFEGTSTLAGEAFCNCPNISSITFEKQTILSQSAFCTSNTALTALTFPAGSEIKNSAFPNCTALKSVKFEGNITLGATNDDFPSVTAPFSCCSALESVEFKGTSTLSNGAFNNSGVSLKNISFGGAATINSNYVFSCGSRNTALTKLVFPAGSTLPAYAFQSYTGLNVVTFEGNVTLGTYIFPGCTNLKYFYFNSEDTNDITLVDSTFSAFAYTGQNAINIYVPSENAVTAYQTVLENAGETSKNYKVCVKTNAAHASHNWSEGVCSQCNIACKHADETKQWTYNDTQHWEVYSTCGAKVSLGNHEYGTDSKCTTCGYTKPTPVHSGGISIQRPTVTTPDNGKVTLSYNGRTATITPDEGYEIASVMVNGMDKGAVSTLTGLRTGDKIEVTFQKTKETLDAEVKNAVAGLNSMKVRSSKTSKGNIKVVLILSDEYKAMISNIKEQGYTVKYRFYRSTKKSSGYNARIEKDSMTFINTVGKKGKMYYYKAQINVYDDSNNLVASTNLANCKYANRRW